MCGSWKVILVPGSGIVGSAELRKCEHENKRGGNWGEEGRRSLSLPSFFFFPVPPTFRKPFTFASSSLSESLEQAKGEEESKVSIILKGKSEA